MLIMHKLETTVTFDDNDIQAADNLVDCKKRDFLFILRTIQTMCYKKGDPNTTKAKNVFFRCAFLLTQNRPTAAYDVEHL